MDRMENIAVWMFAALPAMLFVVSWGEARVGHIRLLRSFRFAALLGVLIAVGLAVGFREGQASVTQTPMTWLATLGLSVSLGVHCDGVASLLLGLVSLVLWLVLWHWPSDASLRWLSLSWLGINGAMLSANWGQFVLGWMLSAWASSELARPRELARTDWQDVPLVTAFRPVWLIQRIGDVGLLSGVALVWLNFGGSLEFDAVTNEAVAALRPEVFDGIALWLSAAIACRCGQVPLSVWLETESGFAARANRSMTNLSDELVGVWNIPDGHQAADRLKADPSSRWRTFAEGSLPASVLAWWLSAAFLPLGFFLLVRGQRFWELSAHAGMMLVIVGAFTTFLASASAAAQMTCARVVSQVAIGQCGVALVAAGLGRSENVAGGLYFLVLSSVLLAVLLVASERLVVARARSWLAVMGVTAALIAIGLWGRHAITKSVWQAASTAGVATEIAANSDILEETSLAFGATSERLLDMVVALMCASEFLTSFALFRAFFLSRRTVTAVSPASSDGRPKWLWAAWWLVIVAAGTGLWLGLDEKRQRLFVSDDGLDGPSLWHSMWFGVGPLWPLSAVGILLAWLLYSRPSELPTKVAAALGPFARLCRNRFYWDDLYFLAIVHPLLVVSDWLRWLDDCGQKPTDRSLGRRAADLLGESMQELSTSSWPLMALTTISSMTVLLWLLLWLK